MLYSLCEVNSRLNWAKNYLSFMEPKGLLPRTQESTTGSQPQPDKFNTNLRIMFS